MGISKSRYYLVRFDMKNLKRITTTEINRFINLTTKKHIDHRNKDIAQIHFTIPVDGIMNNSKTFMLVEFSRSISKKDALEILRMPFIEIMRIGINEQLRILGNKKKNMDFGNYSSWYGAGRPLLMTNRLYKIMIRGYAYQRYQCQGYCLLDSDGLVFVRTPGAR